MKDRFFSKLDWAAFWTATVITFLVYFYTLGPSVGLEDSGELATAAANLGVPHPPGYPFWTFCSWLFCKIFSWVTYMGHPTPAWCVSLCSAAFGALAAGCTAMLICRSAHDFVLGPAEDSSEQASGQTGSSSLLCFGGAVGGALTFALSPVEWSQSTIVEVYSLNAFFLMWTFLLSYRWMRKPSDTMLWLTAFVFGLGLTNYQVLLFAIVPLALVILMKSPGMFRDVFIYLVPVGLTWQILQVGQLMRADRYMQADVINKHEAIVDRAVSAPSTTVLVLALVLVVLALVVASVLRRRGEIERASKAVLYMGGAGALLVFLAASVFTSSTTWSGVTAPVAPLIAPTRYAWIAGFLAASVVAAALAALKLDVSQEVETSLADRLRNQFSRELVLSIAFAVVAVLIAMMVPSAGDAGYLGPKYPWGKSTFVFAAVLVLLFVLTSFVRKGLCFAIPVAGLHLAAFVLLSHGAMNGLTHPCSWWFGWPIAWNFILLALVWLTLPNGRAVAGAAFFAQLGISFYAYMPIVSDLRNPPMNWGYPRTWEGFKHAITRGQYEQIGFQLPKLEVIWNYFEDVRVQFTDLLIPFAVVPFAAGHWIVKKENRKAFWQWMIPAFVCFFLMSYLLIALANVKGDIQDGFIQKVKFISSHAMLAMWIGYGLVFASVFVMAKVTTKVKGGGLVESALPAGAASSDGQTSSDGRATSMKSPRFVAILIAAAMIVVSFVYPLIDNYCGSYLFGVNEVAFKLGGSEQNGHTFGWQFGAYQLEGAKAVSDQLVADEEPLPDPTWPPPMDKFAIFFGGTDPGRFVPTYMIYSALYRPDVYLITQNALADDTYMSVERDLYGDEIWIPAKEDSAEAFNIYVDEVQRGVRQANGDLKIENGRVQVTGALGVMEINGILTKMMHDHDRLRHAFYVEESYVIPWMYPYLSPHGLIMKINAEKTPYDAKTAAKDADFWDWYTRRLLADPMYRRDFAGQKSFSKLRAAIAGLYNRQGRYRESAQAFREACLLYPASPEATFRYCQETLLPFRRWDAVIDLMNMTDAIDPNNRRTQNLRSYVERTRGLMAEIGRLEGILRAQKTLARPERVALARCYFEIGRVGEAGQMARSLLADSSEPAELQALTSIFLAARMDAEAAESLARYLGTNPSGDVNAWIELVKVQYRMGDQAAALRSFEWAVQLDPRALEARIGREQELQAVYGVWMKKRQGAMPPQTPLPGPRLR